MKKTQGEIFAIALKELFTPPMLKLAFLPFVVTVVLFYIVFFYFMSDVSLSSGTGVDIVDRSNTRYKSILKQHLYKL